jgi:Fe-S cluster biogenesis protein NfuA
MQTEVSPKTVAQVEAALESIRPYLIADGGNVRLVEITDELDVKLELLGNCGSCPMSSMTLKAGVEEAIRKYAPEIKSVIATNI